MTVDLSAFAGAGWQFFDNNGDVLVGGKLYTYEAGTTTPLTTYTSSTGATPHNNPIVLNSGGRVPGGEIWLLSASRYKFILKTSTEVEIGSYDNISGISITPSISTFTGTGSQKVFSLSGSPGSLNSTQVYINGVYQVKSSYAVTSNILTFTEAPPITSLIEVAFT